MTTNTVHAPRMLSVVSDSSVTATGGATARTLAERFAVFIDASNFLAAVRTPGTTDDTAALNAVTAALRSALIALGDTTSYVPKAIFLPPGRYSVSSWDLTNLQARNVHILGHGAVIEGRTAGKAVIDCLSSRWLNFHGLTIRGLSTAIPRTGLQLGPRGTETCGNSRLNGVYIIGHFEDAAYMNLGSETTSHEVCTFVNQSTSCQYAVVLDGLTKYAPESDYVTVTRTVAGTALSFTNNDFSMCQFRNETSAAALDSVFIANSTGFRFRGPNYFLNYGGAGIRLWQTAASRNNDLCIDGLFETNQGAGIDYAIMIDGDAAGTAITGLELQTYNPHCGVALIGCNVGAAVRVSTANIRVQGLNEAAAVFFAGTNPGNLSIDGVIETRAAAKLNLDDIAKFNGTIRLDDLTALAGKPPAGVYEVFDITNSKKFNSSHGLDGFENKGDVDATLTVGTSAIYQRWNTALTANRTITLSATGAVVGNRFRVTRTGAGAFTLSVGGLKSLAQNEWCEVVHAGSGWSLSTFGAL